MARERIIIAHHLILNGYGHWLPNDPRGSGSQSVRKDQLIELGPRHLGRKGVQPGKSELKKFQGEAQPRLEFDPIWFNDAKRQAVAEAFAEAANDQRYTVWACAVLKNHAHLCVRRHRDDGRAIWSMFAAYAVCMLRRSHGVSAEHPVWAVRPYTKYLYSPADVHRIVSYIEGNPKKEGLPRQKWPFVKPYDGWPHPRQGMTASSRLASSRHNSNRGRSA